MQFLKWKNVWKFLSSLAQLYPNQKHVKICEWRITSLCTPPSRSLSVTCHMQIFVFELKKPTMDYDEGREIFWICTCRREIPSFLISQWIHINSALSSTTMAFLLCNLSKGWRRGWNIWNKIPQCIHTHKYSYKVHSSCIYS